MTDWHQSLTLGFLIVADSVTRGTALAYAALGETLSERSGVVNLGVEGMMLVSAAASVIATICSGSPWLGVAAAGLAGMSLAAVHAWFCLGLRANQIVSGFALTIFGMGLSGFFGRPYVGTRFDGLDAIHLPRLSDIPWVGPLLFRYDPLVYVVALCAIGLWWLLYRTRFGIQVRAVGNDPQAAFAMGVPVNRVRFFAVLGGGLMAGIGGAHLALAFTHVWVEKMTAGIGWLAVGLVIVARWSPFLVLLVSFLFGGLCVLHAHFQAAGVSISPDLTAMFPYLFAIVGLTLATALKQSSGMPRALIREFRRPDRIH